MNKIERLDWDSTFFGYEVGRIIISEENSIDFNNFVADSNKYRLIYIFSKIPLENSSFNLVDKKTIFIQKIEPYTSDVKSSVLIEQYKTEKHDFEQLKSLAFQSGIYSRFFTDKLFIDNEFQRLYTRWIEMSVNDSKNYTVLVAFYNEIVVGFITLKYINIKKSEIGLIAVSQDYRGLGIGKSLIYEAIQKSIENGIEEIHVTTQLDNTIAVNLYKSTNFNIQEITYIYHWWNSN